MPWLRVSILHKLVHLPIFSFFYQHSCSPPSLQKQRDAAKASHLTDWSRWRAAGKKTICSFLWWEKRPDRRRKIQKLEFTGASKTRGCAWGCLPFRGVTREGCVTVTGRKETGWGVSAVTNPTQGHTGFPGFLGLCTITKASCLLQGAVFWRCAYLCWPVPWWM